MHYLLALTTIFFWGFGLVAITFVLQSVTPLFGLFLRFGIVAGVLLPFYRKPPVPIMQILFVSFTFGILHIGMIFWALQIGIDSSLAAMVGQTGVPFSIMLAFFVFGQKPSLQKIVGVIIAFGGTSVLVGTPSSILHPFAFLLMVGSAFFWAVYNIGLKKCNSSSPLGMIAWLSLFSGIMSLALSLIFETGQVSSIIHIAPLGICAILYASIGDMIIAHGIWGYLMTKACINKILPLAMIVPVLGVIGGVLFLHEQMSPQMVLGSVIMLCGVGFTAFPEGKLKLKVLPRGIV